MKTGTKLALLAPVVAIGCTMLWFSEARAVDLPENRTVFVLGWLTAVALGIGAFVKGTSWLGAIPALAGIFIGCLLPFTVAISEQVLPSGAIAVGDTIPAFTSVDDRGQPFDSERLRGKPVLMKFFRAHW